MLYGLDLLSWESCWESSATHIRCSTPRCSNSCAGIPALLISGIGGILGRLPHVFLKRGNFNPVIGIAAVSCVAHDGQSRPEDRLQGNPSSLILPDALGANIQGVITSAIIAGIYVTVVPML